MFAGAQGTTKAIATTPTELIALAPDVIFAFISPIVLALHSTRPVSEFARASNGRMVVTASPFGANHPEMIAALATRYKLPAVYPFRYFIAAGGLMSYGPELISQSAHAADYVDRILKGKNRQTYRYKCRPNTRS